MRKAMKIRITLSCLLLLLLAACTKPEYGRSGGRDLEMKFFGDSIVVPVGSVGPITLSLVLDKIPLFNGLIKTEEDGTLFSDEESALYSVNVYEIVSKTPEYTSAFTWDCGTHYGSPASLAAILGYMGFTSLDQTVSFKARNPLYTSSVKLHGNVFIQRYTDMWQAQESLEDKTLISGSSDGGITQLAQFNVSGDACISNIQITDLKLDLPGNPQKDIAYSSRQNFEFTSYHKTHLGVGGAFSMSGMGIPISNLSAPIGRYKLKKAVAKLELENTLPLDVAIDSIHVLKPVTEEGVDPEVNTDIVITHPINVAAGSLEKPVVSPVEVQIEALEGTVPDIPGLKIFISVKGNDALAATRLSSKQGLYIKSSSVKLVGGITLNSHE